MPRYLYRQLYKLDRYSPVAARLLSPDVGTGLSDEFNHLFVGVCAWGPDRVSLIDWLYKLYAGKHRGPGQKCQERNLCLDSFFS